VKKKRRAPPKPDDSDKEAPPPRNALYDRANGFALGCFLVLIRFRFAREQFPFHRMRIEQFLAEEELDVALPASQTKFGEVADAKLQEALLACKKNSQELADFALLGALAVLDATLRLSEEPVVEDLRTEAMDVLKRRQLDADKLYGRYLAHVRKLADEAAEEGSTGLKIDTFLTPAMNLLAETLEPLTPDDKMCFVAMPFHKPYASYFERFYRPLATQMECRAFRMWGGLSGEEYVELMLTIMRRCRFAIAELSEANANVLYEFGVARGLGKRVVPLCQRSFFDSLPSNIASDQLLQVYSPREKGWPDLVVSRCAAQVALVDFSLEMAEKSLTAARWVDGDRLPRVPKSDEEIDEMMRPKHPKRA
jgi:hypothetical protein